ncbi:hypothetical protein MMC06_004541 [Schaereria dolodes]|nr:hypothetical protein [Schaereria dolodes]
MALDRREGRDVHFYSIDDHDDPQREPLGGFILTINITKSNLYSMTDVLFQGTYYIQDDEGNELVSNSDPLLPGNYYVSDSVQNGLLLDATIHLLFDSFGFSIDTKDNYKVISFDKDAEDLIGSTYLHQHFLDHPDRPPDRLLDWHYRQALLANVKGAGEPIYDHDFPPGSDMLKDIREGPKSCERMEFELFHPLAGSRNSSVEPE